MALDPYQMCFCGSGKKAKWCCMPIYGGLERAFTLQEQGQHEAALQAIEEVVAAHPDNPEAYSRKAVLLMSQGQAPDAEKALDQALALNPNHPFSHFLRGQLNAIYGDIPKSLDHFRKAVAAYDPSAQQQLAGAYVSIAELEMRLNRPVACRAALQMALRFMPGEQSAQQMMDGLFGEQSYLPESAKKEYRYKGPAADAAGEKKAAWQEALSQQTTGKLSDAVTAFETLANSDPNDAAAWYNLGLTRTWLGDNVGALEALNEYVQRETDEQEAAAAWALGEVLRCGEGLQESEADYAGYSRTYQIVEPQAFGQVLEQLQREQRLVAPQLRDEDRVFTAILTEAPAVLVAGAVPTEPLRFGAHLLLVGGAFRIWSSNKEILDKLARELEQRFGQALGENVEDVGVVYLSDILNEALVFPIIENESQEEEAGKAVEKGMADFFEQTWMHRPLRSLSGVSPLDAAGHETLRKKLRGVVQFLKECAEGQRLPYDFDRLRRKLGLTGTPPATAAGRQDIAAMSTAELAALDADNLADQELEQAYHAAQRLDARELSGAFLKKLVLRPPATDKPDRYPLFGQLIQQVISEGNLDAAMDYVNEGEKTDCEHNEGRRRNDYELWRGRIHAKRGEVEAAQDVFDRLIARVPDEMRYRGTAAEAMLSAKDKERALHFAQEGLAEARKKQDRDSEQYFLELSEAAQRK